MSPKSEVNRITEEWGKNNPHFERGKLFTELAWTLDDFKRQAILKDKQNELEEMHTSTNSTATKNP